MQVEGRTATSNIAAKDLRSVYFLVAGIIVIVDQATKSMAREWLQVGEIIRVFNNDLVWLLFVENPGSAFGLKLLPPIVLALVSLLASIGLVYYLYFLRYPKWYGFSLGLILGGAVGNMLDRIFAGKVVDFVSVDFPDFIMNRFPVFNVADSAVSVGVVWVIIATLLFEHEKDYPMDDITEAE